MAPKTPEQLREEAERQAAENPPAPGHSRTAEGVETPDPERGELFGNLAKVSATYRIRWTGRPERDSDSFHDYRGDTVVGAIFEYENEVWRIVAIEPGSPDLLIVEQVGETLQGSWTGAG